MKLHGKVVNLTFAMVKKTRQGPKSSSSAGFEPASSESTRLYLEFRLLNLIAGGRDSHYPIKTRTFYYVAMIVNHIRNLAHLSPAR